MEIKLTLEELNKIIDETLNHGGDYGGPYYSNKEMFQASLKPICEKYNLVIKNDEVGSYLKLEPKNDDTDAENQLGRIEGLLQAYSVKDLEELNKLLEMATSYEKLSKQVGCPLEVMFKLVEQNELYYQFYNELQHWDSVKVDLRKKVVWFCKQVGGHYACYQPLSNYGKTFWLKQNKEE